MREPVSQFRSLILINNLVRHSIECRVVDSTLVGSFRGRLKCASNNPLLEGSAASRVSKINATYRTAVPRTEF